MIGTSIAEYVFIRACIIFLHQIIPFSALCVALLSIARPLNLQLPPIIEIWAFAEIFFYLLVFLPRYSVLQRPAVHPPLASRHERRQLFDLCHRSIKDHEQHLSKWFKNAPLSEIKRENLKQFYCWAFLNKGAYGLLDDEELEEYVGKFENLSGKKLEPGNGTAVPLRLTVDKVNMLHRPLVWYTAVFLVDNVMHLYMLFHSFQLYRLPLKHFFTVFPFRPLTLFSFRKSPATNLTYWHRPHTSKKKLPVLFIHGIGIGMYTYIDFLAQLNRPYTKASTDRFAESSIREEVDGDIGVIAIELMPISFRITRTMPNSRQIVSEIYQILKHHGWQKVVLVSHSYGSVISTHLLHSELTASMIGPIVLVDPVSILLHQPDVAYNFTTRKPRKANEHQLYYFASMDMGVSQTLHRHFFWDECVLWKEDMAGKNVTVVCAGRDLIVNTAAVAEYLLDDDAAVSASEDYKHKKWKGRGLDFLWFGGLDHGQVFDLKQNNSVLAKVIRQYSSGGALEVVEEHMDS